MNPSQFMSLDNYSLRVKSTLQLDIAFFEIFTANGQAMIGYRHVGFPQEYLTHQPVRLPFAAM